MSGSPLVNDRWHDVLANSLRECRKLGNLLVPRDHFGVTWFAHSCSRTLIMFREVYEIRRVETIIPPAAHKANERPLNESMLKAKMYIAKYKVDAAGYNGKTLDHIDDEFADLCSARGISNNTVGWKERCELHQVGVRSEHFDIQIIPAPLLPPSRIAKGFGGAWPNILPCSLVNHTYRAKPGPVTEGKLCYTSPCISPLLIPGTSWTHPGLRSQIVFDALRSYTPS
jgi:hypothetical protein